MKRCFLLIGMLVLALGGQGFSEIGQILDTYLSDDVPSLNRNVSYVNETDSTGFRWFWTAEGRRDLGQNFRVDEPFDARVLALWVNSGNSGGGGIEGAPFRLIIARSSHSGFGPGEVVAERSGLLNSRESLKGGKWLVMTFSPVQLEIGEYCFLLQFEEEGTGYSVVLNVAETTQVYSGGRGFYSHPMHPSEYLVGRPINFILSDGQEQDSPAQAQAPQPASSRTLEVDRRGSADFTSIAAAAKEVRPGDTIQLVSGSGPYREILFISRSGRPEAPIVFEGNGELITGFEPLTGFRQESGEWVCDLAPYLDKQASAQGFKKDGGRWVSDVSPLALPCVLTYRGERLLQDSATGQPLQWARLSEDGLRLILAPGVEPDGWEISSRDFVIRIFNTSHQIYRNVRISGSLNDGVNLHGKGEGLVFENIEAFHNLDEGFSAHDEIVCEIGGGRFWGNDNGIGNIASSVMKAENIETYANLGMGLWLKACEGDLSKVTSWNNGIAQIQFDGDARVACAEVIAYAPVWSEKPWMNYQESRREAASLGFKSGHQVVVQGEVPQVLLAEQLPALLASRMP